MGSNLGSRRNSFGRGSRSRGGQNLSPYQILTLPAIALKVALLTSLPKQKQILLSEDLGVIIQCDVAVCACPPANEMPLEAMAVW